MGSLSRSPLYSTKTVAKEATKQGGFGHDAWHRHFKRNQAGSFKVWNPHLSVHSCCGTLHNRAVKTSVPSLGLQLLQCSRISRLSLFWKPSPLSPIVLPARRGYLSQTKDPELARPCPAPGKQSKLALPPRARAPVANQRGRAMRMWPEGFEQSQLGGCQNYGPFLGSLL